MKCILFIYIYRTFQRHWNNKELYENNTLNKSVQSTVSVKYQTINTTFLKVPRSTVSETTSPLTNRHHFVNIREFSKQVEVLTSTNLGGVVNKMLTLMLSQNTAKSIIVKGKAHGTATNLPRESCKPNSQTREVGH